MLPDEVHDAPTVATLLEVFDCERRDFRSAKPAAEQDGKHGSVAQPLLGADVRRIQELLGLLKG
jgi:hypothetical protein